MPALVFGNWNFAGVELGPWAGGHIAQKRFLPGVIGMYGEERLGVKIFAAGMAHARDHA